jgi:hypothetical protein
MLHHVGDSENIIKLALVYCIYLLNSCDECARVMCVFKQYPDVEPWRLEPFCYGDKRHNSKYHV